MTNAEQVEVPQDAPEAVEPLVTRKLAAAREAQNLSVTDVANRLKLSVQQVEALEQGAFERLPGPVFVRGFTRNYARLLKLDPETLVREVDAQLPRQAQERKATPAEANIPMPGGATSRWPVLAGVAAVVFLGAALVDVLWPETPNDPGAVAVAPRAPAPAATASAPAVAAAPSMPADSAMATPVTVPAAPLVQQPAAVPATFHQDADRGPALRLDFDQASWVQVKDANGKVVLEALFQPGTSREIAGEAPLTLIIGNAPGVRVTYGDKRVDLAPHTRVAVARLTIE